MELPVTCANGTTRPVTVSSVTRGLAIQREEMRVRLRTLPNWGVLHIASGQRVSGSLPTRAAARALQQRLLALPIDWTQAATPAWLEQVQALAGPVLRGEE